MKLNLGCGSDLRPGWINVDIRPLYPENGEFLCCNLLGLDARIDDDSAEEIVARDVLEFLGWRQLDSVLVMLRKKLAPEGVLFVRVPDFEQIASEYLNGRFSHDEAQSLLFGAQGYPEDVIQNAWSTNEVVGRMKMVGLKVKRVEQRDFKVEAWLFGKEG